MMEAAEQTVQHVEVLMRIPSAGGESLDQMQRAVTDTFGRVLQANVRAVQHLFRLANPMVAFEAQQRFVRDCLECAVQGSAEILRVSRRLTEDALRPIESATQEEEQSLVADVMLTGVQLASPEDSVQDAARRMAEADTGVLPVGEGDRLVGMITDRDIAVRVTAENKDARQTKVRDVMTSDIKYVFEDEKLDHVAENMAEQQVRRMPVVNRDKRLVGIVSIGDLAEEDRELTGTAVRGIARSGGAHRQEAAFAGSGPRRRRR
jgi:CBS domain-containing protein